MKASIISALLSAIVLSACGSQGDHAASALKNEVENGSILQGEFKMYLTSRQVPVVNCDVHTNLVLVNGFAGPMASLQNAVTGTCSAAVDETPRTFDLEEVVGSCGTRRFEGKGLQVVDNRARRCDDRVEAKVIVKEDTRDAAPSLVATTFYSFDPLH